MERETKTIEHGDEQFEVPILSGGRFLCPQRTCSYQCRDERGVKRHLSEQHNLRNHTERTCENCGEVFYIAQSESTKFCSYDCAKDSSDHSMPDTCRFCSTLLSIEETERGYCQKNRCEQLAKMANSETSKTVADD